MLNRRDFVAGASLALLAGSTHGARTQAYPTQTIRIIAGFPAGGGIDISARLLVEPMKEALGQPVIVTTGPARPA
jgi:tripartite-type tricarboxylate transporter receptor subunit TctC